MTRSIRGSRRAALLLSGVGAATSLLASGCGAGQVAETAAKEPSVQGVNLQTPNNDYKIRGLLVDYPGGAEGYQAGTNAAVEVVIYNDTRSPVTVTVTTQSAREIVLAGGPGASATPSPPASEPASPSAPASESPAAPAGAPARIEIPANGYAQLNRQGGQHLQLIGLNEAVRSGQNLFLTFDFGNGQTISGPAPVAVPLTPAAPPSPIIHREGGEESGEEGTSGHGG